MEELITPETMGLQITTGGKPRRRRFSGSHEFAVSLQAYVKKAAGISPLCDHVNGKTLSMKKKR
jgi:hypothetical protein